MSDGTSEHSAGDDAGGDAGDDTSTGASAAPQLDLGVIESAAEVREAIRRRRARQALGVSVAITVVWAIYVTAAGHWDRVVDNWEAALTMVFGSFVAGSTPQGGGAIGFPVLTKALEVPADVARSFSLVIQTVGMGTASAAILINRRRVEPHAILIGTPVAVLSFVAGLYLLGEPDRPFWPSRLPGDYVKVTFTIVLAAMAFVVYLGTKVRLRKIEDRLPPMNARLYAALVLAGLLGGLASSMVGSGADVMIYLFVVILFGVDPRVGVPSSVIVMTAVSITGFILLGLVNGQLDVTLDPTGTEVVAVDDRPVAATSAAEPDVPAFDGDGAALGAQQFDLFGFFVAAAPVVAWGAPMGSLVASRMTARQLVNFALCLAAAEIISTAIFLEGLHSPGGLLAYAVFGVAVAMGVLYLVARHRRRIFRLPGVEFDASLSRSNIEAVPGYEAQLEDPSEGNGPDVRR